MSSKLPTPDNFQTFLEGFDVLKGMVFWRVRDGQIAERWATLNRLGLQQQLTAAS